MVAINTKPVRLPTRMRSLSTAGEVVGYVDGFVEGVEEIVDHGMVDQEEPNARVVDTGPMNFSFGASAFAGG